MRYIQTLWSRAMECEGYKAMHRVASDPWIAVETYADDLIAQRVSAEL